jgi:Tfp pilus assembly protein FimT
MAEGELMTTRTPLRAGLAGAATAALVLAGTAAHAQSTTRGDKAADVLSFADQTTDDRGTKLTFKESVASGVDLRTVRVKHSKKSVAIKLTFANLGPGTIPVASIRLDGASTPSRFVVIAGQGRASVIDQRGKRRCHAPLTGRLGTDGYINIVVKRSCLGTPERIKVSASAASAGYQGDNTPYLFDSLSSTKVRAEHWTGWLKSN